MISHKIIAKKKIWLISQNSDMLDPSLKEIENFLNNKHNPIKL